MNKILPKVVNALGCTKQTPWFCLSMVIILFAVGVVGYIVYLAVYPSRVIEVEEPIPVTEEVLKWGDPIEHKVIYCKYTDKSAVVTLYLENDVTYLLSDSGVVSNIPKGCDTMVGVNTYVPENLPPGQYRLITVLEYKLNPMRTESFRFVTEYFTVVER